MISLVVVSHSETLAVAAVELALQMVHGEQPRIALAAGAGAGITGTDAVAIAAAIDSVAGPAGVLVLVDLGSAVLSAELALEFAATNDRVLISAAPFVEGLIVAVVVAAGGADLDEVEREARAALGAKRSALGSADEPSADEPSADEPQPPIATAPGSLSARMTLINQNGLHARPAALLVAALAAVEAEVTVALGGTQKRVDARSLIGLLSLGAHPGDVLAIEASGAESAEAMARIRALVDDGFGEPPSHRG